MNKDEEKTTGPVLGSARGLILVQPGWDEPMSLDEVEEVFFRCDGEADSPNRQ
jgi:hypothetical protein